MYGTKLTYGTCKGCYGGPIPDYGMLLLCATRSRMLEDINVDSK